MKKVLCTLFSVCFLLTGINTWAQQKTVTGKIIGSDDINGIPAAVLLKGTFKGVSADIDGNYLINVTKGQVLVFSALGYSSKEVTVGDSDVIDITLEAAYTQIAEAVVTAMGIKKERKALGYSVQEIGSAEIMKNKTSNIINSLGGKLAGVNITQSSGAAGSGAQIVLRGGTSLERDNQPLFVVDGVIYDNSTSVNGNSAFDGSTSVASSASNRVMDINPDDIENLSILKGPAAAALYGSRAAAGAVIITTKKGRDGAIQVNFNSKAALSWVNRFPEQQDKYTQGVYDAKGVLNTHAYSSWGKPFVTADATDNIYNNIENFFERAKVFDNNISVSGGNANSNFFLSASRYDQSGIVPKTNYEKSTFRFNGEQKYGILSVGGNVAYSQSYTKKTLTSSGLWGSSGTGAMQGVYSWARSNDMKHYLNEDGSRYRQFEGLQDIDADMDNPYWIINKNSIKDNAERFTGNVNASLKIANWWTIAYRLGVDSYLTTKNTLIYPGGGVKNDWQNGMMSENDTKYRYISSNFMSNMNKSFGDFDLALLLGTQMEDTKIVTNRRIGWNFVAPGFFSFNNISSVNQMFNSNRSRKRLVALYGEFRAGYKNLAYITFTGRNDWSSTLPRENQSFFYPSVSGSFVFSELLPKSDILSFGKIRASWALVGKDADPYATNTYVWPSKMMLGGIPGAGNSWNRGNPALEAEKTRSVELGIDLRFFNNRLSFDYTYYYNNSYKQIIAPRLGQSTGYIFCAVNAGDITNKGMELSITGVPVKTNDFMWESTLNIAGNRGIVNSTMQGLGVIYITDVQVGTAKAASFEHGKFMGISGSKWARYEYGKTDREGNIIMPDKSLDGMLILDKNTGMPTDDGLATHYIGNREPTFTGGWNNTLRYKDWSLSFLWDIRVGGDIYNGTDYYMTVYGMSKRTMNRDKLSIDGLVLNGDTYEQKNYTYEADQMYDINGAMTSGNQIIQNYYNNYLAKESSTFMTKTNWLRLRSISLSYSLPESLLKKVKFVKACTATITGTNLLLFTNYKGMDPEASAAGSGIIGSSSVGIDYCGVPATAGVSFGLNIVF